LLVSAGSKAHVLQHRDVLVAEAEHGLLGRGPATSAANETGRPSSSPSRAATGRSDGPARRPLAERGALRPAEVREDDHCAPRSDSLLINRQAGPDPAVVGDLPGPGFRDQVERDVQVRAQQDAAAG